MNDKLRKTKDKASRAFIENRFKDALKLYAQVVEEDPTELACQIKIGDIHRKLGNKKQAVEAYEPVARHYAEDGLMLKAIAVCKLILSVDAAHTTTQEMLANLYSRREGRMDYVPRTRATSAISAAPAPVDRMEAIELDDGGADEMVVERSSAPATPQPPPQDFQMPPPMWPPPPGQTAPIKVDANRAQVSPMFAWPVPQGSQPDAKPPVIVGTKVESTTGDAPRVIVGKKIEDVPAPVAPPGFGWPPATANAQGPSVHPPPAWPPAPSPPAKKEQSRKIEIEAQLVDSTSDVVQAEAPGVAPIELPIDAPGVAPLELDLESQGSIPVEIAVEEPVAEPPPSEPEPMPAPSLEINIEEPALAQTDEPLDIKLEDPVISFAHPMQEGVPVIGATAASDIIIPEEDESLEAKLEQSIDTPDLPFVPPREITAEASPIELSMPADKKKTGMTADLELMGTPQIPLFSDLPKEAFIEILVQMRMQELGPGEFVIKQGEVGNSFFVLATGRVRVSRQNEDGSETVLAYLTDGAFFGEMALLQDGARTASVIVEEDSQVFEIDRPLLDRIVAQYPQVARVLRNFYMQRLLSTTMATHPLFRSFSAQDRRGLMEKFKSRGFKGGDVLVRESQKGEGLYLLLTGTLEVTKLKDGEPIVIAELAAGDMFGEMSLLTNRPTIATVTAVSDCLVLRLSKRDFDEVIMTHPQVLELVAKISEERETENNAIMGAWTPRSEEGAALV